MGRLRLLVSRYRGRGAGTAASVEQMSTIEKLQWLQSDEVRQLVVDNGLQTVREWDKLVARVQDFMAEQDE
jgi:hypothetical protein